MKLSNMATVLRSAGLTVVETQGWATRGYDGRDLIEVRGVLWHHTVARNFSLDAPSLNVCINGRPDLPGPLCQIVLGRSGTVYLTAAGLSNHAGAGSAHGIPENMGNHYLIGIEMESSGVMPWDWTLDQIRVAPHLGAALERAYLQHLPEDMRLQLGHKEYSYDGKIDPAGWPGDMDGLRDSINRIMSGSITPQSAPTTSTPVKDWFDMATEDQLRKLLREEGWAYKNPALERDDTYALLRATRTYVVKNNAELAAVKSIVSQLAAKQGVEIDYAKIDAIVDKSIADAGLLKAGDVVSVDVNVTGK